MTSTKLTSNDLKSFIKQNNLQAELIVLSVPTPSVEAAAEAVGVEAARIIKSLLFWVGADPVMVIACGPTQVDRRLLAKHFGVGRKQVKLMPAGEVVEISGYPVGAVPPYGHSRKIMTLMDERILLENEVFAGGGAENTLMRVAPEEIRQVTQAILLDLKPMDLDRTTDGAGWI
jgi:prolyl-tRNA editing enzyme YbaK/EbsC (Cys-tRNA(Pro) deacylase)